MAGVMSTIGKCLSVDSGILGNADMTPVTGRNKVPDVSKEPSPFIFFSECITIESKDS